METGQLVITSLLGRWMHDVCAYDPTIRSVVEIGTWRGMGSTKCLIDGLVRSGKPDAAFWSLEASPEMHAVAMSLWAGSLPQWAQLIHGRIVALSELDKAHLGRHHPDEAAWLEQELRSLVTCPDVLASLPDHIDLLLLDGGEFSTYAEYKKLGSRSRIVVLDDTTFRKTSRIRAEVLSQPDVFTVLFDEPHHRNGVMAAVNTTIPARGATDNTHA